MVQMDGKQKFIMIIAVVVGCVLLLVAGYILMLYQENVPGTKYPAGSNADTDALTINSWFNGSRYINTSDNWVYIELTFPPEYVGFRWDVSVYGVGVEEEEMEKDRVFIYSMDSRVNSSVNGVKLNLDNTHIGQFDCFDIEVSLGDMSYTENVCLDELEVQ